MVKQEKGSRKERRIRKMKVAKKGAKKERRLKYLTRKKKQFTPPYCTCWLVRFSTTARTNG
jgi:ribosomal protein L20